MKDTDSVKPVPATQCWPEPAGFILPWPDTHCWPEAEHAPGCCTKLCAALLQAALCRARSDKYHARLAPMPL